MQIEQIDHLVLTVTDLAATIKFYVAGLGMTLINFGSASQPRHALGFGQQKINLHLAGQEFEPKAAIPMPGSADLCLLTRTPLAQVQAELAQQGIAIIEGPVQRTGAQGPILSIYLRDPDCNLIEIANRLYSSFPNQS